MVDLFDHHFFYLLCFWIQLHQQDLIVYANRKAHYPFTNVFIIIFYVDCRFCFEALFENGWHSLVNLNLINFAHSLLYRCLITKYIFSICFYFEFRVDLLFKIVLFLNTYHAYCFLDILCKHLFFIVCILLMHKLMSFFIFKLVTAFFVIFIYDDVLLLKSFVFGALSFVKIIMTLQQVPYSIFPFLKSIFITIFKHKRKFI